MRPLQSLCLAVSVAIVAGCGDKLETIHKEGMEAQTELCEILEGVRSKKDALNVKDRVETLVKKLDDLKTRSRKRVSDKAPEAAAQDLVELGKKNDPASIMEIEARLKKARAALPPEAADVLNSVLP